MTADAEIRTGRHLDFCSAPLQELYRRLCEIIWSPERYGIIVPAVPTALQRPRTRTRHALTLRHLLDGGHLAPGAGLLGAHHGRIYRATLTGEARVRIESGEEFDAPSPAATAVLDKQSWNGWTFWHVERANGVLVRLDRVRRDAMGDGDFRTGDEPG